jgi:lipopolysaccharide export system permease protein
MDLGKNNPTIFLREQEPIERFPGLRMYIQKKFGNVAEGIHIWDLDENKIPKRCIRADRGSIQANLENLSLCLTLYNARQEERGSDVTDLSKIQSGIKASQFPINVSLRELLDPAKIRRNISVQKLDELTGLIFRAERTGANSVPMLTELHKRAALACACFTFTLVGIPLAIAARRREASIAFTMSLVLAIGYYVSITVGESFKEMARAYPEIMVWAPNLILQPLGAFLLWKINRFPA